MRILVLADGSSIHTEQWIKGLALSGADEVHLVTMNPAGIRSGITANTQVRSATLIGSRGVSAQGGNLHYLMHLAAVRRAVARVRPDVITTIYLTSYGLLGALFKGSAFLCHFMVGSDIMITPGKSILGRLVTRYALSRGDYLVSASETMSRRLRELAPIPPERLLTQQYGIDDEVIRYPEQRKEYDLVSNRAWVPNSNIPEILAIAGRLPRSVTLALIGDGGPQEDRIRTMLASLPNVRHLGVLPYRSNIDTVARSRFYLSLTSSDGASLSLMEAMALGAIPIVSDIAPNREWVTDGRNGFLLKVGDPDGSARTIEKILSVSEEKCANMRDQNRRIIGERGSLTVNMGRLLTNIRTLMERRGRP